MMAFVISFLRELGLKRGETRQKEKRRRLTVAR
jgi:hypothetical protein